MFCFHHILFSFWFEVLSSKSYLFYAAQASILYNESVKIMSTIIGIYILLSVVVLLHMV